MWLNTRAAYFVGTAEVYRRTRRATVAPQQFAGRRGIVLCKNFWGPGQQGDHIDLWDGMQMADGSPSYISSSHEVWFWQL